MYSLGTYKEIDEFANGALFGVTENADGETLIIQHMTTPHGKYYRLSALQDNGWIRINNIWEDGTWEETYERSNK